MNLFDVMTISGTALLAERERAEVTASNLANAETTRTPEGGPYRRENVMFAAARPFGKPFGQQLATMVDFSARGVEVTAIVPDQTPPIRRFEPGHPDAQKAGPHAGEVAYPNVDLMVEFTNALEAARSYEANLGAMDITKNMEQQTLKILA